MSTKLKYRLPNIIKFPMKFDVARILEELNGIAFASVLETNGELCGNNHALVKNVYDHFEQFNITTFNGAAVTASLDQCEQTYETNNVKDRIRRENISPGLDERNYNVMKEEFVNGYIASQVLTQFKSPATRVRVTKLNPGKVINPHIDYDPTYAVRVLIPLVTDPMVINEFWRKDVHEVVHLPADGHAYFLNTGVKHAVSNNSSISRIALMISLDGTEDIDSYVQQI